MSKADLKPLERFSDRVDDYVRHRPNYPESLVRFLEGAARLGPAARVADVGSGTGIFSALLLDAGARVFAVEPNDAMRAAAEARLGGHPKFTSLKGPAESTGLPDHSVELVACAQAFHWFDPTKTRREFMRILTPGGSCALVWNTPVRGDGGFGDGIEDLKVRFGTDYGRVLSETEGAVGKMDGFFGAGAWRREIFPNHQDLDFDGLLGRMGSSSYMPRSAQPNYGPMVAELRTLFDRFQKGGKVRMEYETELFFGRFS